jgi:hypothetical protein
MAKSFTLNQLTEGIQQRHLGSQNRQLVEKWSRTGLLRGLEGTNRENMSRLLENQAAQVLREQSTIGAGGGSSVSSGDLRGFSNVAFPMVRRVFGGLVANELVSIQPMSLPSGLLFYLDYTYGTDIGGDAGLAGADATTASTYERGQSIYNLPTGAGVRSGSLGVGGMYNLAGTTYSKVHNITAGTAITVLASGCVNGEGRTTIGGVAGGGASGGNLLAATGTDAKLMQFDPQVIGRIEDFLDGTAGFPTLGGGFQAVVLQLNTINATNIDVHAAKDISLYTVDLATHLPNVGLPEADNIQAGQGVVNVRRLNQIGTFTAGNFTPDPLAPIGDATTALLSIISGSCEGWLNASVGAFAPFSASYVIAASLDTDADGSTLTIPTFESDFDATPEPFIPEIDIKVQSVAVTANTRKLRARWSPELAQDLNAYHSLDAEVELTQILSEQIALEIDREILNDLLTEAKTNYYWSRSPGKFVNKTNGDEVLRSGTNAPGPNFTGTVREWYETLIETVIDVANEIHRLTLRGSANFIVVSPDVATMLEASVLYRPNYSLDGDGQVGQPFTLGAESVGTLSNRFTVYKDPYFPRNKVLVGYKGGSYLETGYVYAPYVPLIVTPTIFAPEDFTPRKGVMTRYGKRMVRNDFYGSVTVLDLNII